MIKKIFLIFTMVLFSFVLKSESLNFLANSMSAGKASLAENSYQVKQLLDTANFSPEMRLPVQLIYDSQREKSGLFGYAWYSPQLESAAYYDKDGVLWTTPWGEKIKFFPKKDSKRKDEIKIELWEEAKKGFGFYSPHADWEADCGSRNYQKSGNWIFSGKRSKKGWTFVYRNYRLSSVTAPSGRILQFAYYQKRLTGISQDGVEFVQLSYSDGQKVSAITINGVEHQLKYKGIKLYILPKTEQGKLLTPTRPALESIRRADLTPVVFGYDRCGLLNSVKQGMFEDKMLLEHQSVQQKISQIAALRNRKLKYSGPIHGRIASDNLYKYTYNGNVVTLTDKLNRQAVYNYDSNSGIFTITDFSGKRNTIYYFMRFDVAYMGKVRKIVDARGRDVANYRYDKLSGNIVRVRDMAGNDINYEYDEDDDLYLITRRSAEQENPEPVVEFARDSFGQPLEISKLNAEGKAIQTTKLEYDDYRQVIKIDNGQTTNTITYNDYGYPVAVENTFGQTVERKLDKYNRMISSTDFYGVKTFYTYTPNGLVSKIERKDGERLINSLIIQYNGSGQPISYTDHTGKTKKFERDAFGRIIKERFPDNTEVAYTYNALGQLTTVLDQNRHTIKFDWNKFGLDAKTTPAGQLTDYVHDKYGLLARVDSKDKTNNDRSVKYEYDKYDRLVKLDYGNGDIEQRTYDNWGKLLTIRRGNKSVLLEYDYWGRIIKRQENNLVNTFAYNHWGQRIRRTLQKDNVKLTEKRSYDKFGRLYKIVSNGKTIKYEYNDNNQLTCQIVDGTRIEHKYNKYGQLIGKKMIKPIINSPATKENNQK